MGQTDCRSWLSVSDESESEGSEFDPAVGRGC